MKKDRNGSQQPDGTIPNMAATSIALFVPIIVATAYLNMGPTCCGNCPPPGPTGDFYPNHVSIEVPVIETEGVIDDGGDEPYFVSFAWEATSYKGFSEFPVGVAETWFEGTPNLTYVNARAGERILLGEDNGKAVFDFPEAPFTEAEMPVRHVKIAGLTMCAFEQDDGNRKAALVDAVREGFATPFRDALRTTYTNTPFSDDSARTVFRNVYTRLLNDAEELFTSLPEDKQQEAEPLMGKIRDQIQLALDEIDGIVSSTSGLSQKVVDPVSILSYIGTGLKVVTNLVELFRKKQQPDNDDFVGCGTIVYVGIPWILLNQLSSVPQCSNGSQGGTDTAVCAFDSDASPIVTFAPPFGSPDTGRVWKAPVETRGGTFRSTTGLKYPNSQDLRSVAHAYHAVDKGQTDTFDVPKTSLSGPTCSEGAHSGECNLHFAHMVHYRTNWHDWLGYEIIDKSAQNQYEIKTVGGSDPANIGVRMSSMTLPSYVRVSREVQNLAAGPGGVDTKTFAHPVGYESSPNLVMIPEILSFKKTGNLPQGLHLKVVEGAGETTVSLHSTRNCVGPFCGGATAQVRVTYLYWDGNHGVHKFVLDADPTMPGFQDLQSDDNENTAAEEPESANVVWAPPRNDRDTSVSLYFPTELWSGGDSDTAFSVRGVGTEVTDFLDGDARLYVQSAYSGPGNYVKARMVNLRFAPGL